MNDTFLWYATRGAGVVSLILLTGVTALGVLTSIRWQRPRWPRFLTAGLHRNIALLSVVFLVVHIVTAVIDPFVDLGWLTSVVPFSASYRQLWLGLGVISSDLVLAVVVTSLLRNRLGFRVWRVVHWLAYGAWPLAMTHSLGTGTDAFSPWLLAIEAACAGVVFAAVIARVAAAPRAWRTGPIGVATRLPSGRGSLADR